MIRVCSFVAVLVLAGCADPSTGAALNECRMRYFLYDAEAQSGLIADCMRARSFEATACDPAADEREWDRQVRTNAFDNPRCWRSARPAARMATFLSPM
jgi:hypothetical protein